jgi:DNA-binding CsgD family transcriptional regulator
VAAAEIAQIVARRLGLDERVVQAFGNPDPRLAEAIDASAAAVADGASSAGIDDLLALEPLPHHVTDPAGVDELLPLFGIMADLAAPFLLGHSDRVARLASAAAELAGMWPHDVTLVRRAGWVHDIGRLSVSPAIWTKVEPLADDERAAIRLHPYVTARVLARTPHLAGLADVAAAHHERLDGSGYHRGLAGVDIDPVSVILAAADAYVSAGEWRPHRPARPPVEQAYLVLGLARDGALPHWAVDAVIAAARTPTSAPQRAPNTLTADEQRVLDMLAAGSSEAAIARPLGLTALGVRAQIEALYAKLGASTRASAIVVAVDNGWLDLASRPLTL